MRARGARKYKGQAKFNGAQLKLAATNSTATASAGVCIWFARQASLGEGGGKPPHSI
jgi:hypothetical protein